MRSLRRRMGALARVGCLMGCLAGLALPTPVAAQGDDSRVVRAADIAFDIVVLRPVGVANSAVGAVLFVPAALLTSPGGRDLIDEAWERFVRGPVEFTYQRPLGEF